MNRRDFLLNTCLAAGALMLNRCSLKPASSKKRPNIILILSDDQGWGDVSFNGATDLITPHLDSLAESGVVFTNGYASHPYCSPSRAGLLTGRYQQRFGHECNMPYDLEFENENVGLPLSETLLSNVMKDNGYKTCAIGKWHLGNNPLYWPIARGFDYWYGFYGGGFNYWGRLGEKPAHAGVLRNGKPVPEEVQTYLTDDFSREAIDFVERHRDEPYLISWPNALKGRNRYHEPITGLDVFPTVLAAAGIKTPEDLQLDGRNLLPYIRGEMNGPPHERLFWRYSGGAGYAIREGRYKLVNEEVRQGTYLFDLESDPYEMHNLSEEMPEKTADLQAKYDAWSGNVIAPKWNDPHIENVVKTRERRKAMIERASSGEKRLYNFLTRFLM